MKKISLFVALAVAGLATAQVQMTPENLDIRKASVQAVVNNSEITMEAFSAKQPAAAADYAAHDYYHADGMLHSCYTPQFYGLTMPLIMLPFTDQVVWENYYGPTNWYSQATDELLAENSETLVYTAWQDYGLGGMYYLMYTGDHTLTQGDQTYNIKGYYYAESKGIGGSAFTVGYTPITISTGENIPMTLAGMQTALMDNESGSDFYQVSSGSTNSPYAHGTALYADAEHTIRIDTMGSIVRNVSPMKISAVNIPIYNSNSKDITGMLPEGAAVKVEIFAADLTQGIIYTDSLLAETTFSAADYVDVYGTYGTVIAKFWENDPFGGVMEVPVMVEGDFYIQLTNYNESGCDFGVFSDFYTPGGTTIFTVNGSYTTLFKQGSNLAISYDAYWPVIANDTTVNTMNVPVEGGIAHYGDNANDNAMLLYTNVADVDNAWIIDAPEWIGVGMDTTYLTSNGAVFMMYQAEALPVDQEYRQGVVTIDADGFVFEVTINQGDVPAGVEDFVSPIINDNKRYNLLGVEVDENYKGVVIMNGKKFIQ